MAGWYSARELSSRALPGLPTERARLSQLIARTASHHPDLVRPRAGRGGGLEVSELALPEAARAALKARAVAQIHVDEGQQLADDIEQAKRQIATAAQGSLTARQRHVMQARQTLLLYLDAEAISTGCGRDRAIRNLVADAAADRLDEERAAIVRVANDKAAGASALISRATLYRWFALREREGQIGLAPDHMLQLRQQRRGQPSWLDGFLKFYAGPAKPSAEQALRDFSATLPEGTPAPTARQVHYWLKKLPQLDRLHRREGKLALRARLAYTARDFTDLLPTSVYTADGKTFDAEIAHPLSGQPFRPEITTILDVATRKIVGWSAALDESAFAVVDALRRACAAHGIPAIFYTDRGPGYKNRAMQAPLTGFLSRAGITSMHALPYNSQAKGAVERVNQVYTPSAKRLATYIGRDMDKEAKRLVHRSVRSDLALTGTSRTLPGWSDFIALIDRDIAAYNNRPHSSLPKVFDAQLSRKRHMTPGELWALKCESFEPIAPDAAELDDMFRPYVVRRTRRALVEWLGNSYFAPELEPRHGEDVVVGYDIKDASKVWVREIAEIDGEQVPGRLIAVAIFEGHKTRYVPLSAERAAIERRAKGQIARLERKIDVVGQQLKPAAVLDMEPGEALAPAGLPATDNDRQLEAAASWETPPAATPAEHDIPDEGQAPRPVFRDDVSFALWIAGNPDRASASDKEYVRDLLTHHSSNELLRMSGVDLDALRKLLRPAA